MDATNPLATHIRSLTGPTLHVATTCDAELELTQATAISVGFRTYLIDGDGARSKPALFDVIAREMEFPSYSGRNWDALVDCLRDVGRTTEGGIAILIRNTGALLEDDPASALPTLIDILRRRVAEVRNRDVPEYVLFARSQRIFDATPELRDVCDHGAEARWTDN